MRLVDGADVRRAVSPSGAEAAVRQAFLALHDGSTLAPDELAMTFDNGGELHVKGAHLGGRWAAFKVATGQFAGHPNSGLTMVIDTETGAPAFLLDDVAGDAPGRTHSDDITVVDLCGLGIQDAAMADLVVTALGLDAVESAD